MSVHGTTSPIPASPAPPRTTTPERAAAAVQYQARGVSATFRSLRHRNYRLYFCGQLISLVGSWMQSTAMMWLAYELTRQSLWPALITAAQILPTFLLGAWGGLLADRWPKRSLLLVTQTAFLVVALVLAGLVLGGTVTPWQLLLISALNGLIQAMDLPARLAIVMELVGREDLMNAVALNSLQFNVARAVGPAVAGWLLGWLGPGVCFLANGLSYFAVLAALASMDVTGSAHVPDRGQILRLLLEGFGYLARRPLLALLVMLSGSVTLSAWPFLALLPGLATRTLGADETGYSLMLSGTGFGALAAALAVASFGSLHRRRQFIGIGLVIVTLALLGLSQARSLPLAVAASALAGFGLILFFATGQSVVQLSAGEHNRGRVMGIWAMIQSGALPLGNLLTGPAADRWGEPVVLAVQGGFNLAAALVLVAVFSWWARRLGSAAAQPE